jgi:hypothetical protein
LTTNVITIKITHPRNTPNNKPNNRSNGPKPTALSIFCNAHAKKLMTMSVSTKTTTNPAT